MHLMACLTATTDVETQGQYQMLDPAFIGLIFSVFGVQSETQVKFMLI